MKNSTLVFVGFGENEILPSYLQIDISGLAQGRVTHKLGDSWSLTANTNPLWGICLPAQRDAIDQYLMGYDRSLVDEIVNSALEGLSELGNKLTEHLALENEAAESLKTMINEHHAGLDNRLAEEVDKFSEENYLGSLRQTISSLSPADLVDVARSLIELQALRQTTTGQLNTVGGPIDVALISPLTGFEWVRHKTILKR